MIGTIAVTAAIGMTVGRAAVVAEAAIGAGDRGGINTAEFGRRYIKTDGALARAVEAKGR
jgi:uncharacterized metal-binding protein